MKQITMYEAIDGTLHRSKRDALMIEARKRLEEMLLMEIEVTEAIEVLLANPHEVRDALYALAVETAKPSHFDDD
jgi:hypothetical protein